MDGTSDMQLLTHGPLPWLELLRDEVVVVSLLPHELELAEADLGVDLMCLLVAVAYQCFGSIEHRWLRSMLRTDSLRVGGALSWLLVPRRGRVGECC